MASNLVVIHFFEFAVGLTAQLVFEDNEIRAFQPDGGWNEHGFETSSSGVPGDGLRFCEVGGCHKAKTIYLDFSQHLVVGEVEAMLNADIKISNDLWPETVSGSGLLYFFLQTAVRVERKVKNAKLSFWVVPPTVQQGDTDFIDRRRILLVDHAISLHMFSDTGKKRRDGR